MHLKVLVYATQNWRTRKQKHANIKKVMMLCKDFEDITFHTELYFGGKPKLNGDKIDQDWFEETFSKPAKAKGYNYVIFSFSMAEGRRWGIDSGLRAANLKDNDFFGEGWVRADERSITKFKGGQRNRYEKSMLHEPGHELKNQGLTTLNIHDYDHLDVSNLEDFYSHLRLNTMNKLNLLKDRITQLIKQFMTIDNGLLPLVKRRADLVLKDMEMLGHPMRITQGYRSIEHQNALYAQGRNGDTRLRVTNAKGGDSLHQYGVAADFVFRREGYDASKALWETFGKVAEKHGFEWGGRWTSFVDKPHLEMKQGYSLADFKNGKVDYLKFN